MNPLTLLIEGLAAGAVPALLGAGLALVHRTTGILSFAHATTGAGGAYAAYALSGHLSGWLPGLAGGLVAVVVGGLLALPIAAAARRLGTTDKAATILLTLGYALILEALLRQAFGSDVKAYLHLFETEGPIHLPGGGTVARSFVLVIAWAAGAVLWAALVLSRTTLGLALRAAATSPEGAAGLGLSVVRLQQTAWFLSGAGAGFSGWLLAPRLGLEPQFLWAPMLSGFVACALGGLDRPGRVMGCGFALGVAERLLFAVAGASAGALLRWVLMAGALLLSQDRAKTES